ncbi:MAG: acyl-CoA dehydrogenase [Deltaproteobacteria bacterium]|nr:acyl-CoA dehydrogenase [Deltaproteobacteria bacterium]
MGSMLVDERDIRFVLFEQLKVQELCGNGKFSEFSGEVFEMVLAEALKFAENILFPLNIKGDKESARFEDGKVYSTPGTKEAYQRFVEGGWLTPCEDEEIGGQGMPHVIMTATHEMFFVNFPFMCYVNLTHDGAKLIELYGTDEQKRLYMEPMYGGQWTGTMALTEAGAGSDVGVGKCKAIRKPDGSYFIVGSKIFITNGEHDVAENIVHMVLARIEGDPPGTKGLSIFIVPKYRVNKDGSLGEHNDINCVGIEHKMGLNASPTTSLAFGENGKCTGYILGQEREGIKIMFHMMNVSRLEVGMWGQSVCSASYLHALNYAREREQGMSVAKPDPLKQVPIIEHPDIRRQLLTMKAHVEGMRAMLYYCGYAMDRTGVAEDDEERQRWGRLVDLLIPICKAYPTEKGVLFASDAIQIHGGYGYSSEYPVEQFMRDSKVACIFEGTTGIQAMDLTFRKLGMKKGKVFADFLAGMDEMADRADRLSGWKKYADQFRKTKNALSEIPSALADHAGKGTPVYPFLKATPVLEAAGDVVVSWFLLWGAVVAQEKLEALFMEKGAEDSAKQEELIKENAEAAYLAGKVQSARFFIGGVLPVTDGKIEAIKWGDCSAWETQDRSFGV